MPWILSQNFVSETLPFPDTAISSKNRWVPKARGLNQLTPSVFNSANRWGTEVLACWAMWQKWKCRNKRQGKYKNSNIIMKPYCYLIEFFQTNNVLKNLSLSRRKFVQCLIYHVWLKEVDQCRCAVLARNSAIVNLPHLFIITLLFIIIKPSQLWQL